MIIKLSLHLSDTWLKKLLQSDENDDDDDDDDDIFFAMIAHIQLFSMLPLPFQWFSITFKHITMFFRYNSFQ